MNKQSIRSMIKVLTFCLVLSLGIVISLSVDASELPVMSCVSSVTATSMISQHNANSQGLLSDSAESASMKSAEVSPTAHISGLINRAAGLPLTIPLTVNMEAYSDGNDNVVTVWITAGQKSAAFDIPVIPGKYRLRAWVDPPESGMVDGVFYDGDRSMTPNDRQAVEIDTANLPTSLDLDLLAGTMVRGKISRPAGVITPKASVNVEFRSQAGTPDDGDDDWSIYRTLDFNTGELSKEYVITVPQGDYKVSTWIDQNANWDGLQNNLYVERTYYAGDHTTYNWSESPWVSVSSSPISNIDIEYQPWNHIKGTISRPLGMSLEHAVNAFVAAGNPEYWTGTEAVIQPGEMSAGFDLKVYPGIYTIDVWSPTELGLVTHSWYIGNGPTSLREQDAAKVDSSSLGAQNIAMTLIPGTIIRGTITRPAGYAVDKLHAVLIWQAKDVTPDDWSDNATIYLDYDFASNETSKDYAVTLPQGEYIASVWVDQNKNSDGYQNDVFTERCCYMADGSASPNLGNASPIAVGDSTITGINIDIKPWNHLKGTISRPLGMSLEHAVNAFVAAGNPEYWTGTEAVIQPGEMSAGFDLKVYPGIYTIDVWSPTELGLVTHSWYIGNGPTSLREQDAAKVDSSSLGAQNIAMTLIPGTIIRGTITRPAGYAGDKLHAVLIWQAKDVTPDDWSDNATIYLDYDFASNETSKDYAVTLPQGEYIASVWVDQNKNSDGYQNDVFTERCFYTSDGSVCVLHSNASGITVANSTITGINIDIQPWSHVMGTIHRPVGYDLAKSLDVDVILNEVGVNGEALPYDNQWIRRYLQLPAYAVDFPFDIKVAPGSFQISVYTNPEQFFIGENIYAGENVPMSVYRSDSKTFAVDAGGISGITLSCIRASIIKGTITRASDDNAQKDLWFEIIARDVRPGMDGKQVGLWFRIDANTRSLNYSMGLPTGEYSLQFNVPNIYYPSFWLDKDQHMTLNEGFAGIVKIPNNTATILTGYSAQLLAAEPLQSATYLIDKNMIRGIAPSTTSEKLLSGIQLPSGYTAGVLKKDGTNLPSGNLIGTGMRVQILDGTDIVREYTVVIFGDTTGDGNINALDLIAEKRHILGLQSLTGAYATAANTDHGVSGSINALDLLKIKRHILGLEVIVQ